MSGKKRSASSRLPSTSSIYPSTNSKSHSNAACTLPGMSFGERPTKYPMTTSMMMAHHAVRSVFVIGIPKNVH